MNRLRHTVAAALGLAALASTDAAAQNGGFPQVRAGQTVEGSLTSSAPRFADGRPFKVFQFQGQPGRRYTATMESEAFDAYLVLARMNAGITENLRENDDGGDGTSARLRFTLPASGTYLLVARSYSTGRTGAFTLRLEDAGPIVIPRPAAARVGETVRGTLSDTDGFLDESEKNYDLYLVRGQPGEDVHVVLASEAFDAFLESGELGDGGFRVEESNDDYEGRSAALQLRLGVRGEAVVRATSLSGNQEGAYTLSVRAGRLPPREDTDISAPGVVEAAGVEIPANVPRR
jgi:hypothetical protein